MGTKSPAGQPATHPSTRPAHTQGPDQGSRAVTSAPFGARMKRSLSNRLQGPEARARVAGTQPGCPGLGEDPRPCGPQFPHLNQHAFPLFPWGPAAGVCLLPGEPRVPPLSPAPPEGGVQTEVRQSRVLGSDPNPQCQEALAVPPHTDQHTALGPPPQSPGLPAAASSHQGWLGSVSPPAPLLTTSSNLGEGSRGLPPCAPPPRTCSNTPGLVPPPWRGCPRIRAGPTFPTPLGFSLALEPALSRQGGTGGGHSCRAPLKSVG